MEKVEAETLKLALDGMLTTYKSDFNKAKEIDVLFIIAKTLVELLKEARGE